MGYVDDSFYAVLMKDIGAPFTSNLYEVCHLWQSYEGGGASFNPFNTTQKIPGSSWDYNGVGVQNYSSAAQGIQATWQTLTNGYYPKVVAAFRANLDIGLWGSDPDILAEINTWGTHGFAAYLSELWSNRVNQLVRTFAASIRMWYSIIQPTGQPSDTTNGQPFSVELQNLWCQRYQWWLEGNPNGVDPDEIFIQAAGRDRGPVK